MDVKGVGSTSGLRSTQGLGLFLFDLCDHAADFGKHSHSHHFPSFCHAQWGLKFINPTSYDYDLPALAAEATNPTV